MTSHSALLDSGFDRHLGLVLSSVTEDEVVGRLPVRPVLHQPFGIVHGGVYSSVVETAASVGAALWFGDRGTVVGVSNYTHFLRAVREGELAVCARPVHRDEGQQLWDVQVTDEQGRLVATGEVRLANLRDADGLGRPAVVAADPQSAQS